MSEARKGSKNPRFGKSPFEHMSPKEFEKYRKNRSIATKGEKNVFFGKHHTYETKEIISYKRRYAPRQTCEYCGMNADIANFSRWHGKNCKKFTLLEKM